LRWIYDRRDIQEAQRDLAAGIGKWQGKYPKLLDRVETNIGETLNFYRLPRAHHKPHDAYMHNCQGKIEMSGSWAR
jgi:transposase-like protein